MRNIKRFTLGVLLGLVLQTSALGSVNVTVNGSTYAIPQTSEKGWGTVVTSWIQAVSSSTLQKSGGSFSLTADADFGASFGLKAPYFKSYSSNPSGAGVFRLANTDSVGWRNIANGGNLLLTPSASTDGVLKYNGVDLLGSSLTQTVTNKTIDAGSNTLTNIADSAVSSSAAIARTKLASGTASRVLVNDGSGVMSDSSITSTLLGDLGTSTSANTASTLVKRGASGEFSMGALTATSGAFSSTLSGSNLSGTNTGDVTLAAVGAVPNANGGSLSGQALTLQPANGSFPGVVTTAAQTFAGVKTFSSAPNLSSLTASLPLQLDGSKNVTSAAIGITGGGTGQVTKAAGFDALSPMSASGDIIYGGASGTGTRLPKGADGTVLTLGSGLPSWVAPTASSTYTIASKTANYTVTTGDYLVFGDSSGGAFTLTLPTAVGNSGKVLGFYKTDTSTNLITIDGSGTETINGDLTLAMGTKGDYVYIISDNANWKVINFGIFVGAQYYASANLAISANAVFKYNTKLIDSHAAYATATGLFTVPSGCSGYYRVNSTSLSTGAAAGMYVMNNGSAGAFINAAGTGNVGGGSQTLYLNSGQTVGIASDAGTTLVGSSAPYRTAMSIERLN